MFFNAETQQHQAQTQAQNICLKKLEEILQRNGKSLQEYEGMPFPDNKRDDDLILNSLIHEELQYDRELLSEQLKKILPALTSEQKNIYDCIVNAVDANKGGRLNDVYTFI